MSVLFVRETHHHAKTEASQHDDTHDNARVGVRGNGRGSARANLTKGQVFALTSFKDRSLSAASQAGMVHNLNDGLAWGLFPVLFISSGLSLNQVGILAAVYPAVWGAGQLVTGAASDRWGRKWLIVAGMLVQAAGLATGAAAHTFRPWLFAAILLGLGTAMVYPALPAAIGDVAHPMWRARSVGIYRLWRDGGFAIGALLAGLLADRYGIPAAITTVAVLTAISGVVVAARMRGDDHTSR